MLIQPGITKLPSQKVKGEASSYKAPVQIESEGLIDRGIADAWKREDEHTSTNRA